MSIGSKHPVREAVASIETYWNGRFAALCELERLLAEHGIEFDDENHIDARGDARGDEGRITVSLKPRNDLLCSCCQEKVETLDNVLVYSWYKMQSGRFEITCYLS